MPIPTEGESREHFMNRCIPMLIEEGRKPDQAFAICNSLWNNKGNKKLKNEKNINHRC